jgi:hypothetical protein
MKYERHCQWYTNKETLVSERKMRAMKLFNTLVVFMLTPALIFAYEEKCMPNLVVPTVLESKSLEVGIVHRFLRNPTATFPDNFINMANVKLTARYIVLPKLEVGTGYISSSSSVISSKEYFFNTGYSYFIPQFYLRTQAMLQFYREESAAFPPVWSSNMLYQLNLQGDTLWGKLSPVINLAYDTKQQKVGLGTGVSLSVADNIELMAEYYPNIGKRDSTRLGGVATGPTVNCYAFGVKYTTFGHHFILSVGNSTDLGIRNLMRGTANNNIYFGFTIQRLFSL